MKSRESRKIDHIKYALHLEDGPCATGFSDIQVFHRALPQADRRDIDLSTALPGIGTLAQPLVINAITGGAEAVKAINGELAAVARETGCAMAVGSQYGAVRKGMYEDTFAIARQVNPRGMLFANVSALASSDEARRAVDMIQAQALQIHLNSAQELAMEEGDRDFSHWLEQIEAVCARSEVPVIVKETGCGMAREDARRLLDCGVSILDTGGAGGTNFPAIEGCRYPEGNRGALPMGDPFGPFSSGSGGSQRLAKRNHRFRRDPDGLGCVQGPDAGSQCSGDGRQYPAAGPGRRDPRSHRLDPETAGGSKRFLHPDGVYPRG